MRSVFLCITFTLILSLAACSSNPPAPVIDRLPGSKKELTSAPKAPTKNSPTNKAGDWRPDSYVVKKGDTLYSIGLEHGYYYKDIASANNITAPYNINVGQTLRFSPLKDKPSIADSKPATVTSDGVVITPIITDSSSVSTVVKTPTVLAINEPKAIREPYSDEAFKKPLPQAQSAIDKSATTSTSTKPTVITEKYATETKPEVKTDTKVDAKSESKPSTESSEDINWAWPTNGKVVASFNEANNKGLDIAGTSGQAISAAAEGKVIYSGSDLRGYGKLVIIKHNSTYLSVYAHNSLILAKEGQQVSRGQKIAEMGNTDSNTVKLHFEIRRQGKSVDPSKYLTSN
jgi:lipoprotein NlpD